MKFLRTLICAGLLALFPAASQAWTSAVPHLDDNPFVSRVYFHGFIPAIQANSALSGIVGFDCNMDPFVNKTKCSGSFQTQSGAGAAAFIYPNFLLVGSNLPNGTLGAELAYSAALPSNYTDKFVFANKATYSAGGVQLDQHNTQAWGTVYSIGAGTTITGCTNSNVPPCQFDTTGASRLVIGGTNPVVTFDLSLPITGAVNNGSNVVRISVVNTNIVNGQNVTVIGVAGSDGNGCGANGQWTVANRSATVADLVGSTFPGGCTYTSGGQIFPYNTNGNFSLPFGYTSTTVISNATSICIAKLADYTADNTCNSDARHAWAGGFNDDFVSKIATVRPHHIRYLDVNLTNNTGVPPDYANWMSTNTWSYSFTHDYWVIPNWFGSNSGTNSYSIACSNGPACTYKLTSGAPAQGDFIQFFNVNANTSANPTIAITDANSVTSSPIPLFSQSPAQSGVTIGGTPTTGDTISLTVNTTPLGAYTCLAGGTHTTSAYTVGGADTSATIAAGLASIVNLDTTLAAQPLALFERAQTGTFQIYYASHACTVTITANVTGSATETVTIGPVSIGAFVANTMYSAIYNTFLGGFIVSNLNPTTGGSPGSWPWIVQIQLAEAVSTKSGVQIGCWLQPSIVWSDASFTSLVNFANSNQCPGGTLFEVGNEIWNLGKFFAPAQALAIGASLGLSTAGTQRSGDPYAYYELRQRQWWAIASGIFGGISGNLHTISAWQVGSTIANELNGTTLFGTSGAIPNQAYQNAIGIDYTVASGNGTPASYTRHLSQAPYYHGGILDGTYLSAASYGSWSATSSSVAGNVLTVGGTITGTIWPNQGIAGCDGTFIATSAPTSVGSFTSAQLSGTVTTTLNGAISDNAHTWVVTSTAGITAGMSVYNVTTGSINATVLAVVDGTHLTIGAPGTGKTYRSAGTNDTIVFGGLAGTYQLNNTSCAIASGTITGGDVLGLQYMADNYCTASSACSTGNVGLGSLQDAYNWIAQDLIAAPLNNQSNQGVSAAGNVWAYQQIASIASPLGINALSYEGGLDEYAPTTAQAVPMGLPSSSYGMTGNSNTPTWDGYIGQALFAFKNSSTYKTVATSIHNQELFWEPAGSMSQKYVFSSNARWSFFPLNLYSTPYQDYNAMCVYNGGVGCSVFVLFGWRRRRKDTASNDNSPKRLENAA